MTLLSMANRVTAGAALFASITVVCSGQVKTTTRTRSARTKSTSKVAAPTNSASHVAVEMTDGKLRPSDSKPGDTFAVTLQEDVRSNGEVVLKKGTNITGVVKNVRRAEGKNGWKAQAQSMIEVEWRVPSPQGHGVRSVSFALESVVQINRTSENKQNNSSDAFQHAVPTVPRSSVDARPVRSGGGLLVSESGGSVTATPATANATTTATAEGSSTATNGRSNTALLSMPSVVAADEQTSASIKSTLGTQTSGQLFKVGHGQLVSSGGSKESVELYSHLINDTVITSPSTNFEISSGAQMQMLVGVNRK